MTLTSTPRLTVQLIRDASDLMLLLWPPVTAGSQRRLEYRGPRNDGLSLQRAAAPVPGLKIDGVIVS